MYLPKKSLRCDLTCHTLVQRHSFFYLPSYLIASLDDTYAGEIIENVVYSLDPQEDIFLTRIEGLSYEQKDAIKRFIKYYAETETIKTVHDERIEQFWENYSI